MSDTWVAYWDRDEALAGALWKAQTDFFMKQLQQEVPIYPQDVVLDIGCGKGYESACLAGLAKEVHGLDTSERNVQTARTRYASCKNLFFHTLPVDNYLSLTSLAVPEPTLIVCVSVVQYYKNIGELRTLIAEAKAISAPKGRMLLADLLVDYNLCKDVAGVFIGGLQSGTCRAKLREMVSGSHNIYARMRSKNPLLTMATKDVEEICASLGVSLRFIPRNLTGNYFRGHAFIEFP